MMHRVITGRSSGKTYELMKLAKKTGATIACSNPNAMQQKAHAYGFVGIDFISYNDLFSNGCENNIMIDELEHFVRESIQANMIGYTLTNED